MIDLRSDTVTKPTPGMLAAMTAAAVGDDVFGEDPTVNELELRTAALFGHEAALFVPSGTMSNQIAVRVHCRPQDEVLLETTSHIYLWEAGGAAALSGVTCRTLDGRNGLLDVSDFDGKVRPDDVHAVRTRLVSIENTHNRGGGTIYSPDAVAGIWKWAKQHGIAMHLDGARIWNAIVATGVPAATWGGMFDTVSVCFSKGLGTPVGSALIGPRDLIKQARRYRKLFGGGMRQAGFLAAACLYALDHHIDRLAEDHANAQILAAAVRDVPGLTLDPDTVETNLVWFEVSASLGTAREVGDRLKAAGVLVAVLGERVIRAVTHLDVTREQCERAAAAIRALAK
ncbi:threonine aldolase : Threonine aldolase OS=Singulisphaera acidiphila (strain ATCC BAA-1392 / DSM 18658 / VKM B-2454 / MOB10) GN=Sinac_1144 PE=4 SV=1: Beta_elim_lyase [Gemmataceae bacterium]|nr:threonine aldolase : Threonine aldolase OS=Singulisphaera acidiphila (strain ATCC BAA-1392 / DSM 18658 / VKM B-2454 / MOB10) GN=Sinac_1144 PE=4 SV=1: Beta_elim_lyase [Gemmataceae bacterium]VTT99251.1 threonine aldolase : Threonine aldolase OS=Singulisphaera acidiphila (strain ATCC BAA-1392 / DSM 18658 / VKM B-2454 / MOB10) GN=Sinac_1144 PE=4 SV=1: Beta_elim_lyase [Gemmataceae bacterium]